MASTILEQSFAVNPFGKKIEVDKRPEIIEDVKLEISDKVNYVFEEYKKFRSTHPADTLDSPSHLYNEVLTPLEIDLLLQLIMTKTDIESEPRHTAGHLISRMIFNSYDAGNNNFQITTNDCNMSYLFSSVYGTKKNPLIASVYGNVGAYFGSLSEYCAFDINGNSGDHFGWHSKYCNHTIQGNVDRFCGEISEDCTYNIIGNAGSWLANLSKKSIYNMFGDVGQLKEASTRCTFNLYGKSIYLFSREFDMSFINVLYQETCNPSREEAKK